MDNLLANAINLVDDDDISIINIIGFMLLIISGSYIIVDAKNNKDE